MKNRRLNVLFIAIIALAAAPQALQDMGRLVSVAQERAETEFWSVFLSYQTTESKGAETRGATELVADRRSGSTSCPLERVRLRVDGATRNSQSNENSTPARSSQQFKRASAKAQPAENQPVEQAVDDEAVASLYRVRTFQFSEEERDASRAVSPHARDAEKLADVASKASLASFLPENENLQIRVKQVMEMDRALRQRVRFPRDRSESNDSLPAPNPTGSM